MLHYHGTPVGGPRQDAIRFLKGRHGLVPFPRQEDMPAVADACESFVLDNGAFTVWKSGGILDVPGYIQWVKEWCLHPGFDWALIPDVIEGTEEQNDELEYSWKAEGLARYGVPVWHLHESTDRLIRLCADWPTVALGSSGKWAVPGTESWWGRMTEAMTAICDKDGRPAAKLHGLRMLSRKIFTKLPLSSADSTNAVMNSGSLQRFGCYKPPTSAQRCAAIADIIEFENSAPVWNNYEPNYELKFDEN